MSHARKGVKELHGAGFETQRSSQKPLLICAVSMSQEDQNKQKDLGRLHSNAINGTHIWRKKGEKEASQISQL